MEDYLALKQLGVMLEAGVAIDKALGSLAGSNARPSMRPSVKPSVVQQKLSRVQQQVSRGVPLSKSLLLHRCVSSADSHLLTTSERAGRVGEALVILADRRSSQAQMVSSLKASLFFPIGLLIIGSMAGILIKLVSGQTVVNTLLSVMIPALLLVACLGLALRMLSVDSRVYLSIGWNIPLLSDFLKRSVFVYRASYVQSFYVPLCWQIQSGVAFDEALSNNREILANPSFQRAVSSASRSLSLGKGLAKSLVEQKLVLSARLEQVMLMSQDTGSFDASIIHELNQQRRALKLWLHNLTKWFPRLAYLLVLVVLTKHVL